MVAGERLRRGVRSFWDAGSGGLRTGSDAGPGRASGAGLAGRLAGAALAPCEAAFRVAVAARNRWYDRSARAGARGRAATGIPVVSVGNLIAGGTGKTPVTRWLAEWFGGRGLAPAVVVRGCAADEVALHERWFGAGAVFAGRDRRAGVRAAAARGRRVAVLDDGFQHRRLARRLDLLVVAAEDPLKVRMHPRGPYREPLSSARRASQVLLTRRVAGPERVKAWRRRLAEAAPGVPVTDVELAVRGWFKVNGAPTEAPRGDVLAVCAIGRPQCFAAGLEAVLPRAQVELAAYADHHPYRSRDVAQLLARLGARTLVCTEKDAVKLAAFPGAARRAVVAGFGVAGEPRGALLKMLEGVAGAEHAVAGHAIDRRPPS